MEQTVRNYLDQSETIRLARELEANRASIEGSGKTYKYIAEHAEKVLGFRVTVPNITTVLEALKINPGRPRRSTANIDDIKRALVLIARAVHQHAPSPGTFEAMHILLGSDTKLFDLMDT